MLGKVGKMEPKFGNSLIVGQFLGQVEWSNKQAIKIRQNAVDADDHTTGPIYRLAYLTVWLDLLAYLMNWFYFL
jgi:hypothetical protein